MGSVVKRKKLSDITNIGRSTKLEIEKLKCSGVGGVNDSRDHIAQLLKENSALLKLVAERNKMIEMKEEEVEKLQTAITKVAQQNLQLARTNTQMQAELNFFRERMRELQHELGCTNAVLKSKSVKLEEEKLSQQVHERIDAKDQERDCIVVGNVESCSNSRSANPDQSLSSSIMTSDMTKHTDVRTRKSTRLSSTNLPPEILQSTKELEKIEDVDVMDGMQTNEEKSEGKDVQLHTVVSSSLNSEVELEAFIEKKNEKGSQEDEKKETEELSSSNNISAHTAFRDKVEKKRRSNRRSTIRQDELHQFTQESGKIENVDQLNGAYACKAVSEEGCSVLNLTESSLNYPAEQRVLIEQENQREPQQHKEREEKKIISSGDMNGTQAAVHDKDLRKRKSSSRNTTINCKLPPSVQELGTMEDLPVVDGKQIIDDMNKDVCIQSHLPPPAISTSQADQAKFIEQKNSQETQQHEKQETRRLSTGRPTRKAAEKVSSYKEISLKVKMRRE